MARVELGVSRMKARRRKRRALAALIIFFIFVIIASVLVWLSRAPFLRITTLHVKGIETIATSSVEQVIASELGGYYGYLFAKNNIFLYPKSAIAAKIGNISSVKSVDIHAENFHTIAIELVERHPKAEWCGVEVASTSRCSFVDESGAAYAGARVGESYVRYFGGLTASTTPPQYLLPGQFRALSALIDAIAQNTKNDSVESVYVDQNDDVHTEFASGFTLLFELGASGGDVYQRFQLALTAEPFVSHTLSDFQYLDLRFGDKLYYKLK